MDEPVERATIKINNMKDDDHKTQAQLESLTLRGEDTQTSKSEANQEEMVVAPDIPGFEGTLHFVSDQSNCFFFMTDIC